MQVSDPDRIEVVYALPERQWVVYVDLVPGLTAIGAVQASGLIEAVPELRGSALELGVFGRRIAPDKPLDAGDRVEILRPLLVDPRESRRRLAATGRTARRR